MASPAAQTKEETAMDAAAAAASGGGGGEEIAFFDVETSIPNRQGAGYALLEFGAMLVCPRRLVEVGSYATLVRPADLNIISAASTRCNGITRDAVAAAPSFQDVADTVYTILHGRVWAGHNIIRFDCLRIREAFTEIGRTPPEAKGMIDTLPLLTKKFGRRAGDMKMASLANYFGLGRQAHRSLDDVRMNVEVLKYCATVLFLESSLPDVLSVGTTVHEHMTRSQANDNASPSQANSTPDPSKRQRRSPSPDKDTKSPGDDQAQPSTPSPEKDPSPEKEPSDLISHIEEMKLDTLSSGEGSSGFSGFLEPDQVSMDAIRVSVLGFHYFGRRTAIYHKDHPLQLCFNRLKVHFGVSSKYVDAAGRPKLSIVVDIPENLSKILDHCDSLAQKSSQESGSTSEWRAVSKRNGYVNLPTVRLNIPTGATGDADIYATEIYKKEPTGNMQKLSFTKLDAGELQSLFVPGTLLDAFFSLDIYDYQQNAGIRLVAKRLVIPSE